MNLQVFSADPEGENVTRSSCQRDGIPAGTRPSVSAAGERGADQQRDQAAAARNKRKRIL